MTLQRHPVGHAEPATLPSIVQDVLRSPGQPLDAGTRAFFEPRFGHDFSKVRVHTDAKAAESARTVSALAYTFGQNVVFGAGRYSPGTMTTQKLLAHELAHVIQQGDQNADLAARLDVGPVDDEYEREAERIADRVSYRAPRLSGGSGSLGRLRMSKLRGDASMRRKALTCDVKPVVDECKGAAAKCMTVAGYCKKKFPTVADLNKTIAEGKKMIGKMGFGPNAKTNFKHYLDGSGTELVMPATLFENHLGTKKALMTQRQKFLEGAKKRLEDGRLSPGGTADMRWTGAANAFITSRGGTKAPPISDDLAYAVGGYQLCSNVRVRVTKAGGDHYKLEFLDWKVQAFDCYNWDPGKGIGIPGLDDKDLCCLEDAGKAKHFLDRTDPWENTYAESRKDAEITAKVKGSAPASSPAPAPGVTSPTPAPPPVPKKSGP